MGNKRNWLHCGLIAMLLLSLIAAGCSRGKGTENSAGSGGGSGSGSAATENAGGAGGGEDKSPVTFTYFAFGSNIDKMASETTIGKILQEQTGVDWKMEFVVGDPAIKAGVMISGGEYPDVISPVSEYAKLVDAGAFIPLNDLIGQHGPNIMRVYGPYLDKMKHEDGNIYILPFTANIGGYISDPNPVTNFWIQRRVLKEFGYPKIKTLDEYFGLIEKYHAKYPVVDGKETIGFGIYAGDAAQYYTITNPPMHLSGNPNDGNVIVDLNTHEAKLYQGTELEKRWLKALHDLHNKGLLDPESFTANGDQFMAKITSGRMLGFVGYIWQIGDAINNLKSAGNDDLQYVSLPIVFDADTTDAYVDPPSFVNNRGLGISVSAKDPVRIIKYWDNLLTEENQKLTTWGQVGVTYEVDEKGRFYMTEEQIRNRNDNDFRREFGFAYFEYEWPRYGNNSLYEDGNAHWPFYQPEVASVSYTEGDKELLKAYGVSTFAELYATPIERPWYPAWSIEKPQGSPEALFNQKAGDLTQLYYPKLVLAPQGQFDAVWDEYMKEFGKLDAAGYEAFMTQKVRDRVAGKW